MVRVAVAQIDPHIAAVPHNLRAIEARIAEAADRGAEFVVLPECAATGYVFGSYDEAWEVAEPIPGPISQAVCAATERAGIYAVVGTLERSSGGLFNTAILSGPSGLEAIYRKTHTLCLGVDRFTTPGDLPFRVHSLPFGRVGILICYDLRFPEPVRLLALQGAQIIALPTNWPVASVLQPEVFTRARAAENRVFVLAADRVGVERGGTFLGRSQVVDPDARVLAEAPAESEALLVVDIDPHQSDLKNVVMRPGEHEMDCMADRRVDLYGALLSSRETAEAR